MYAKIVNPNANTSNMSDADVEVLFKLRGASVNGIQYPASYVGSNLSLFNTYPLKTNVYPDYDAEIQNIVPSHYELANNVITRAYSVVSKPQAEVNIVLAKRQAKADYITNYGYREQRRNAYITQISPEKDPITTLGDVVDALYYAVWHNDTTKLAALSVIIEDIKENFPKPTANTV